jgi:soluble lytic murein transglycosylase-like protein
MRNLNRALFFGVTPGVILIIFLANLTAPRLAYAAGQEPLKPGSGIFAPLVHSNPAGGEEQGAQNDSPPANQPTAEPPTADQPAANPPAADQPAAESSSAGCPVGENFPESVRRWCDAITRHAANNGLDPNLVAAVMLQESGGNPQATSHSGAVGLLQVMPRDGVAASFHCVNGPCFASRPSMAELYDPEFNLSYGTRMLAGLVQKYGNPRDALMRYGPANVGYSYADKILGIYARSK